MRKVLTAAEQLDRTVAELEAQIAALSAKIAPLAKQRSKLQRKKRSLILNAAAAKARKANAIPAAKVKALALKYGTNVKAVERIARELNCSARTVYRKRRAD